jgi:hypothetical protein
LACRATLKVGEVLEQHEAATKKLLNDPKYQHDGDQAKDLAKLKVRLAVDIVKPYLLPLGLGVVSIAALTGSHVILTKRNGAIMAAYAGLDRAFKEYRSRVSDEFGNDVDRRLSAGASEFLTEEKLADGSVLIDSKKELDGRFGGSAYAVVFDELSSKFSREPGRNAMTIQMIQNYANDKLRAHGHLFLNEVMDMLGLPRTKAGAVVGWFYDPKNEKSTGDNYVDFGVFTGDDEWIEAFLDGKESIVVLDFNVDGIIYDKI